MTNKVTISYARLRTLLKAEVTLSLLEQGGVDNWNGRDEALYGDHLEMSVSEEHDEIDEDYKDE